MQNRLRIAGIATEGLARATERLFNISNETRTPIAANAQLLGRLSLAADSLGASQDELFQFVENVGKALAIQGSSAQQARGAIIQLSQAVGAGIVRAEEFNAILEGGLPIAQAAAKGLGITVAELRRQIIDGQIESNEFFRAILSQTDNLAELFAKTTPTISQAFTILTNNFTKLISDLNQSTGILGIFSNTVILLANNIGLLVNALAAVAIGFAAFKIGGLITAAGVLIPRIDSLRRAFLALAILFPRLAVAVRAFGIALTFLARNPIIAIIGGITLLVLTLDGFIDKLLAAGGEARRFGLILLGLITIVREFLKQNPAVVSALAAVAAGLAVLALSRIPAVVTAFTFLIGVLAKLAATLAALAVAILTNPIGLLVISVTALITATVILVTKFQDLAAEIEKDFPIVKAFFDFIRSAIKFVVDGVTLLINKLKELTGELVTAGAAAASVDEAFRDAGKSASGVGNKATEAADKTTKAFRPLRSAIADPINSGVASAGNGLDNLASSAESSSNRIVASNARSAASFDRVSASASRASGGGGPRVGTRGRGALAGTTGTFGASGGIQALAERLGADIQTAAGVNPQGGLNIIRSLLPTGLSRQEATARANEVERLLNQDAIPGISRAERAQALNAVREFKARAGFLQNAPSATPQPSPQPQPAGAFNPAGLFQQGGSFTVPGLGGGDTRNVAIGVSGGEEVDIRTRRQQDDTKTVIINITQNITTPNAESFNRNRRQNTADTLREIDKVAREI